MFYFVKIRYLYTIILFLIGIMIIFMNLKYMPYYNMKIAVFRLAFDTVFFIAIGCVLIGEIVGI